MIKQILPKLNQLAPVDGPRRWETVEDHLTTPTYKIQLVKDDSVGDAVAKVIEGPNVENLPFSMEPQSFDLLDIPSDLPRVRASALEVFSGDNDKPAMDIERVCLPDTGEVVGFLKAQASSEAVETGIVHNHSLDAMAALLQLYKIKGNINVTKPIAVATTGGDELKIAGLLHTCTPSTACTIEDIPGWELAAAEKKGLIGQWKAQVAAMLRTIHAHNLVHGFLRQRDISIDMQRNEHVVWLNHTPGAEEFSGSDGGRNASSANYWKKLDETFDTWIKEKIEQYKQQTESNSTA